jgi:hypothetical protein
MFAGNHTPERSGPITRPPGLRPTEVHLCTWRGADSDMVEATITDFSTLYVFSFSEPHAVLRYRHTPLTEQEVFPRRLFTVA